MTRFEFIHIGHGKCLSTMLQRRWAESDRYNYCHGLAAGNMLSDAFLAGSRDPSRHPVRFALNDQNPNVLSYECFTFFGCAPDVPTHRRHMTLDRQAFIASALAPFSDRVLLVLRDPKDWIRSCHAQYVKYGGALSLQGYFDAFRVPLLDNLRLDRILQIWRERGFAPVALAMEAYTSDPRSFWADYERQTGLPEPGEIAEDDAADNRTDHDKLEPRALANGAIEMLIRLMERNELYQLSPQHRKELEVFSTINKSFQTWTVRRAFEAMDTEDLRAFCNHINFVPSSDFLQLELDDAARDLLTESYVEPLSGFAAFEPHLDGYRASLAGAQ
ncbi:hypothetical protein [Albibacillus kandeliae]|uniref:hypothetical protein n=1 Tax=Albibacillus kandeliae TaxID=2174228 RepID=UPI000D6921F4|nr:hypothetical protein [Albibacillus kandeliae]